MKTKLRFAFCGCFLLFGFQNFAQTLHEKYPRILLNEDHGVLKEPDMFRSDDRSRPYTPQMVTSFEWQCFPIKDLKVKYRKWRDADGMGPSNVIVTMCDFDIWNKKVTPVQDYGGRRAKEVTYCNEFRAYWKKLTKLETYICLSGESVGVEMEKVDGKPQKVQGWVWNAIKTKKGCYSYFDENCD